MTHFFVVPAMKIGGGIREVVALADDMAAAGADVAVVSMWRAEHPMECRHSVHELSNWPPRLGRAAVQMPALVRRFAEHLKLRRAAGTADHDRYIFTHYSTFPLTGSVLHCQRFFFVQGLEWTFVHHPWAIALLRRYILNRLRTGQPIAANQYLGQILRDLGYTNTIISPIWAHADFRTRSARARDIDAVMVLRPGAPKRLDLYHQFITLAQEAPRLRLAVISPEDDIIESMSAQVDFALLRPTLEEMRALYSRSRLFVHLSEQEGFGLPPLEAMGAGCIPLCRDSGGVRAYMSCPGLDGQLFPLEMPLPLLVQRARDLLADPSKLEALQARSRSVFEGGLDTARARQAAVTAILAS